MKLSELEINKILIDKEITLSSTILRKYLKSLQKESHIIEELIRIKGFDKISLVHPERIRSKETLSFKQKFANFFSYSTDFWRNF